MATIVSVSATAHASSHASASASASRAPTRAQRRQSAAMRPISTISTTHLSLNPGGGLPVWNGSHARPHPASASRHVPPGSRLLLRLRIKLAPKRRTPTATPTRSFPVPVSTQAQPTSTFALPASSSNPSSVPSRSANGPPQMRQDSGSVGQPRSRRRSQQPKATTPLLSLLKRVSIRNPHTVTSAPQDSTIRTADVTLPSVLEEQSQNRQDDNGTKGASPGGADRAAISASLSPAASASPPSLPAADSGILTRLLSHHRSKKVSKSSRLELTSEAQVPAAPRTPAKSLGECQLEAIRDTENVEAPQPDSPTTSTLAHTGAAICVTQPELTTSTAVPQSDEATLAALTGIGASSAPAMRTPTASPPKALKRKPSLRDRFRSALSSPGHPTPDPAPIEEPKPHVAYVPRHAASDFVRLGGSPSPARQSSQRSSDEEKTLKDGTDPVNLLVTQDDADFVKIRRLSPTQPMQTLLEDTARVVADIQPSEERTEEATHPQRDSLQSSELSSKVRPRSQGKRNSAHSYKLVSDPWDKIKESQRGFLLVQPGPSKKNTPPSHTPTTPSPQRSASHSSEARSLSAAAATHRAEQALAAANSLLAPPGRPQERPRLERPLSDYELFIAQAEAEDRRYREHVWRSLSQRSSSYVRPDPHLQFASASHRESRSSFGGRPSEEIKRSSRLLSSTSNGADHKPDKQQKHTPAAQQPPHLDRKASKASKRQSKRMSKRMSWMPADIGAETTVEHAIRMTHPPRLDLTGPMRDGEDDADLDDDGVFEVHPPTKANGQQRSLKRQASISKRISEYIRPSRDHNPYEDHHNHRTAIVRKSVLVGYYAEEI